MAACGGEVSDVGTEATDDSFDDLTIKPVILLLQFEPDLAQLEYVQSLRSAFEVHVVREATERADAAAVFQADVERELSELDVPGSDVVLIISGHSVGYVFWGNAGESLQATSMNVNDEGAFRLDVLAKAHPEFASRVRHIFLMGCNAGRASYADLWRAPFPRTLSVSGFAGSAPTGRNGGNVFIRGTHYIVRSLDPVKLSTAREQARVKANLLAMGFTFGAYQLIPSSGVPFYVGPKVSEENQSYDLYVQNRKAYELHFLAGPGYEQVPTDSQGTSLRSFYNGVQGLVSAWCGRNPYDPNCHTMQGYVDPAIRLIHDTNTRHWWLAKHEAELRRAGIDVDKLLAARSRGEVVAYLRTIAPYSCPQALQLGSRGQLGTLAPSSSWLVRTARALCGLSTAELPPESITSE